MFDSLRFRSSNYKLFFAIGENVSLDKRTDEGAKMETRYDICILNFEEEYQIWLYNQSTVVVALRRFKLTGKILTLWERKLLVLFTKLQREVLGTPYRDKQALGGLSSALRLYVHVTLLRGIPCVLHYVCWTIINWKNCLIRVDTFSWKCIKLLYNKFCEFDYFCSAV